MKRSILLLGAMVIALLLVFQSCKKDNFSELDTVASNSQIDLKDYDDFGHGLSQVVDKALGDKAFKDALINLTQKREMGDFEVLLTTLLNYQSKSKETIKELFLQYAEGIFTKEELNAFLEKYPSFIIATRGNIVSWIKEQHTPPDSICTI